MLAPAQQISRGGKVDHCERFHCIRPCEGIFGVQRRVHCLAVKQPSTEPHCISLSPALLQPRHELPHKGSLVAFQEFGVEKTSIWLAFFYCSGFQFGPEVRRERFAEPHVRQDVDQILPGCASTEAPCAGEVKHMGDGVLE